LRNGIYQPAGGCAGGFVPVQIVHPNRMAAGPVVGSPAANTIRWLQGVAVELAVDLHGDGVVRLVRELLGPCSP